VSCLVCGGKKEATKSWRGRDKKKKGEPGCGKQLDSAAKSGGDGGIWCRECLVRKFGFPQYFEIFTPFSFSSG
jgi:hypothetical protein